MKITKEKNKITASEAERFFRMVFRYRKVNETESNLPYEKSRDDWLFYGKAILRIIKEIKK